MAITFLPSSVMSTIFSVRKNRKVDVLIVAISHGGHLRSLHADIPSSHVKSMPSMGRAAMKFLEIERAVVLAHALPVPGR